MAPPASRDGWAADLLKAAMDRQEAEDDAVYAQTLHRSRATFVRAGASATALYKRLALVETAATDAHRSARETHGDALIAHAVAVALAASRLEEAGARLAAARAKLLIAASDFETQRAAAVHSRSGGRSAVADGGALRETVERFGTAKNAVQDAYTAAAEAAVAMTAALATADRVLEPSRVAVERAGVREAASAKAACRALDRQLAAEGQIAAADRVTAALKAAGWRG